MKLRSILLKPVLLTASIIVSCLLSPAQSSGAEIIRVRGSESSAGLVDSYARGFAVNYAI